MNATCSSGMIRPADKFPTFATLLLIAAGHFSSLHADGLRRMPPPAKPPSSTTMQRPPGVPPAGTAPAPMQGKPAIQMPPAQPGLVTAYDFSVAHTGASVYSTGADDVLLTILTPLAPLPAETATIVVTGIKVEVSNPNASAFPLDIYLVSPGPGRRLTSNRQYGRTINLGKLSAGEIVFAIKTPQGNMISNGDGARNSDKLPHASVKKFKTGAMEVWFEDLMGPRPGSDRDFNDAVFQLSGGVSDNNAVGDLLKVINEQKGETRQQAINALKKLNPRAAASAGFR